MADKITVPTYEQIETILTKLATNYSNLAIIFYDVFYNTTPMDVTFQMYDESGVIQTYTIPNRAKDRSNILNGSGSPQGTVEASTGTIYQDLESGDLYIKETSSGNVGWVKFVTSDDLKKVVIEGIGHPEGIQAAAKGTLYIDKINAELYIKTEDNSYTGWALISANTSNLANRDLSNLSSAGEGHFANLSLSNINAAAKLLFDAKENVSNKITSIQENSTDTQYPSAKATYNLVASKITNFAYKDLSNISDSAKSLFVSNNTMIGCILSAPRGILQRSENVVSLMSGTILLVTNGRASNNTFNNTVVTAEDLGNGNLQDTLAHGAGFENLEGRIFYDGTTNIVRAPIGDAYIEAVEEPTPTVAGVNYVWFDPSTFTYHYPIEVNNEIVWSSPIAMAEVGRWRNDSEGEVDVFIPYYPVQLVNSYELAEKVEHTVIEVGGTEENWYRLYKDGWIEAGGYLTGGGTVNLLKEFKSVHYTLVPSSNATSFTKNTGSFEIVAANNSVETNWVANGWSA